MLFMHGTNAYRTCTLIVNMCGQSRFKFNDISWDEGSQRLAQIELAIRFAFAPDSPAADTAIAWDSLAVRPSTTDWLSNV